MLPIAAETVTPKTEENDSEMTGMGGMIVTVTAVRGLYPVKNAKVTVFTGKGADAEIITEAMTDESGKTPVISLPAPSSVYTDAPDPSKRPYAYYNIRTVADGYINTENYNLAVFDNITSVQNVALYPLTTEPDRNQPIIIDEFDNYEL